MASPWQKIEIKTEDGKIVKSIAPLIISASRATDIPAFFSKWFFNRLEKGYVKWINRFNPNNPQYVSFQNVRAIVFWTKNARPILPYLKTLDEKGIHYYFQYTVNDYDTEEFEPNVPPISERLKTIKSLAENIGKEKIIWRFDPLILTEKLTVEKLLKKVHDLGNKMLPYTNKLVYSYIDILKYKNVQKNLIKNNLVFFNRDNLAGLEFTMEQKTRFAAGVQSILAGWRKINPNFRVATCAEDIELRSYDIEHNKCIDDELMIKLFPHDKKLMEFLNYDESQQTIFLTRLALKDKGQRKACCCIVSKDIGSYNTCSHLCIYCYANNSRNLVLSNQHIIQENSESLLDCR